jgi:uncharacterized membrane protein
VSNSTRADDAPPGRSRGRRSPALPADPGAPSARPWLAWSVAAALAVFYSAVALRRHAQLLTSAYDLAIYDQAVRSYSQGHLPFNTIQGPHFDVLGDHFSPVLALLAPLYWIHDSPTTLLVAQAVLIALGVVPLMRWAQRDVGLGAALVVGLGYGLSSGVANAVTFDFHEVAFAAPLLSFAVVALGQQRLTAAVLWAAPLVLVKEDLGLTVAVLGLLVAWRGKRLLGLATAAGGGLASALAVLVVIPAFNPAGRNTKVGKFGDSIFHQFTVLLTPDVKIVTLVLLLAPTAFLAVRSPLLFLAVPTIIWRFLAIDPAYWGTQYHYGLVLMPVLFAAFVDVLRRPHAGRPWYLVASAVVTVYLVPQNGFAPALTSAFWRTDPAIAATRQLLDRIPTGTTVAASNQLAPQLTDRDTVTLIGRTPLAVSRPEYIVSEIGVVGFPLGSQGQAAWLDDARAHGYSDIGSTGTVVLLQRNAGALDSG